MTKSVLILKGFSKTELELQNDRNIILSYIDFFCSNAGGAFNKEDDVFCFEEPDLMTIKKLPFLLNENDYLIILILGHGINKDGKQIFQLQENLFIQIGQLVFKCKKQLFIIETCRNICEYNIETEDINDFTPKYKFGGEFHPAYSREKALFIFNSALQEREDGILYLFSAEIGEGSKDYLFLKLIVEKAIFFHEYFRNQIFSIDIVFELVKHLVVSQTQGNQIPVLNGEGNFPFVITIN